MKDSTSAGKIRASDFYQYYYCKRKLVIEKVYGLERVARDKMLEGSQEHERERKRLLERTDIYKVRREEVESVLEGYCMEHEGIAGCPDIIIKKKDGSLVIVELKLTDYPFETFARKAQIYAYAYLAEKRFLTNDVSARIYYTKQKKFEEVPLPEDLEQFVKRTLEEIKGLLAQEKLPEAIKSKKCGYCEFYSFCWG